MPDKGYLHENAAHDGPGVDGEAVEYESDAVDIVESPSDEFHRVLDTWVDANLETRGLELAFSRFEAAGVTATAVYH